ncbi:MAG: TolC family outer membrane protein [Neomegalonema sp.]|nr:TolC family outer membrane protein [Neomegalonema sp.]
MMSSGAVLALLLGGSGMAQAETLADALVTAVDTSPTLAASRARLRTLDELAEQARAGGRPSIAGTGSVGARSIYARRNRSSDFSHSGTTPASIGLSGSQMLYDGGQTANAVSGAEADIDTGRFDVRQTEQNVLLEAVTSYVEVLRAQENVAISRNNVGVIGRQLSAAQDRFDVGEVTRTDVAQARARRAQSQATLQTNLGTLGQARQSYIRAVGTAPLDLAPLPPMPDLPESLEEAIAIAENQHPAIIADQNAVKSASFGVRQAIGGTLPSVDLTGDVGAAANSSTQNRDALSAEVALEASVPLYQGGALSSRVRAAQALVSQRRAELFETTRLVKEQVGVAWETLKAARATIEASQAQIRAAQVAFDGVREEAKVGSRTTLDVLDAEQELLDARFALVNARSDEYVAGYQLLAAIGLLTVEHLGLNTQNYDPAQIDQPQNGNTLGTWPETEDTEWLNSWRP